MRWSVSGWSAFGNGSAASFRAASLPLIKDHGSLTSYDVTIFPKNAGGTVCIAYAFDVGSGLQVGVGLTVEPAPGAPNQRSRATIPTNWSETNSITCSLAPGATIIGVNYSEKP